MSAREAKEGERANGGGALATLRSVRDASVVLSMAGIRLLRWPPSVGRSELVEGREMVN